MTIRTRILGATLFLLVLFLWGIGLPLLGIFLDTRTGEKVQESLFVTLKEKYPDLDLAKRGAGKGRKRGIPRFCIEIKSPTDPQARKEILGFVGSEIKKQNFKVLITLDFSSANKRFSLEHSSDGGLEWKEHER